MDAVNKEDVKYYDNPLNGKLITSEDPLKIGEWNFQKLVNLSYKPTGTGIKGIMGMSNINSVALSCASIRTGYHFKKNQPAEDHIFAVGYSGASIVLFKSNSIGQIPNSDTFSSFLGITSADGVYFAKAPDGCMVVCNGDSNYIWGGSEFRCAGFVMFDPSDNTKFYDYTDKVNNTLTDAMNVATIKGTSTYTLQYPVAQSDTYVKATSKFDTNYWPYYATDPAKSLTGLAAGNSWLSNNGTVVNQRFHIDLGSSKIIQRIYYENFHASGLNTDSGVANFTFWGTDSATSFAELTYGTDTGWTQITTATTAFEIHAANDGADPKYITATSSTAYRYYAFKFADGWGAATSIGFRRIGLEAVDSTNIYVGSTRPIRGVKFYIGSANTSTATMTPYYWSNGWQATTNNTDNTSVGGVSFAQTGTVTFDDTVALAKPSIINNTMLYWYKLDCGAVSNTTTVYRCTVDAGAQTVKDIWDGVPRTVYSFLTYTGAYNDYTLNVYQYDFNSADDGTYVNVSDLTSSQYILCGFSERCSGISISLVGGYANLTAATTMTVSYWTGSAFTTVGTISDGTSFGAISFSRAGIITWSPPAENLEFTYNPNNTSPLYYYKISFNETIDNTASKIYIDYVYGIPAQKTINGYKFPVFWQNRLWLCNQSAAKKNWVRYSSSDTNCVFNGTDSGEFPVDGDNELMAGGALFTRFGGYLYDNLILCKRNQTFLIDSTLNNSGYVTYNIYTISQNVGCVAPNTMKLCDVGYDLTENIKKHILVWESNGGIVMFDGNSIINISDDIEDFFQADSTNYINTALLERFYGEFDPVKKQYHWCFATGTSAYLNKEMVYDLRKKGWFEIQRGAKALQCIIPVEDQYGNRYMYGGTKDGYVERLGVGTTFHGVSITYNFRIADLNRSGTTFRRTQIDAVQLVGKTKSSSAQQVAMTHYADGSTTGTTLDAVAQTGTGLRYYRKQQGTKRLPRATFHDIDVSITTDDETVGFEPLLLSYKWQDVGDNGVSY
jgi:hypothetical protein